MRHLARQSNHISRLLFDPEKRVSILRPRQPLEEANFYHHYLTALPSYSAPFITARTTTTGTV